MIFRIFKEFWTRHLSGQTDGWTDGLPCSLTDGYVIPPKVFVQGYKNGLSINKCYFFVYFKCNILDQQIKIKSGFKIYRKPPPPTQKNNQKTNKTLAPLPQQKTTHYHNYRSSTPNPINYNARL